MDRSDDSHFLDERLTNAMTVDVEDYFQVSAFSATVRQSAWEGLPRRVVANTQRLLELFEQKRIKATFFVLGWIAERERGLVKDIAAAGHEVACHGYSHQLIYEQSPGLFRQETRRAKQVLEDLVQRPVYGYRAASYSITRRSEWALDVLAEEGFKYDSSIFPVRHDRYGIPDARIDPHWLTTPSGRGLIEFPLATATLFGMRMPVAGGGYFRLFPYALSRAGLRQNNRAGRPFVFYLHPWEIDPSQPRIAAGVLSRFRHYNNLHKCYPRLERLLNDFSFSSMDSVLGHIGLPIGEVDNNLAPA